MIGVNHQRKVVYNSVAQMSTRGNWEQDSNFLVSPGMARGSLLKTGAKRAKVEFVKVGRRIR